MKISLFKNCKALKPFATLTLPEIVKNTKQGTWKKEIETLRNSKNERRQKSLKKKLPAFTLCGESNGRDIVKPSGYIGIDIDQQDHEENILEKFSALCHDKYVHAAWPSSRGLGIRLVFKINPAKHEESFLGIEKYLYEKYSLTVDRDCKDVNRLSFVSYSPDAYIGHNKKLFNKLVKVQKIPEAILSSASVVSYKEIKERVDLIVKAKKDVTEKRENWIALGLLCTELGEEGRTLFHEVSQFHPKYEKQETDSKFNDLARSAQRNGRAPKTKITTATLDFLMRQYGVIKLNGKMKLHLSNGHEDKTTKEIYATDMRDEGSGVYTYKLLEFRIIKKKFKCIGFHTQRVAEWLVKNGYRIKNKTLYHIHENTVKEIFVSDMQDRVLKYAIEEIPKGTEFKFDSNGEAISKDECLNAAMKNVKRVVDSIAPKTDFDPEDHTKFLHDREKEIFLKYSDSVVSVVANDHKKIPYSDIKGLVWHKSKKQFPFEIDKGESIVEKILDQCVGNKEAYMTAVGYMISTYVQVEGTPILFCTDTVSKYGQNKGGNGKDFIRQILSQVREVVKIPAAHLDFKKEFSFTAVNKDTEIIWLEDLNKNVFMSQFYNLTDGAAIRKLYSDPFTLYAKIGVSLQHTLDMTNSSDKRRQIFLVFNNYFSTISKGIKEEHGRIFDSEWSTLERQRFNYFIIRCCQLYLKKGVIQMPLEKLIEARREEVGGEWFRLIQPNKEYKGSREVMDLIKHHDVELPTLDGKKFISLWSQCCDLNGGELEERILHGYTFYTMKTTKSGRLTKGGRVVKK